eukprot:11183834-Alexandrium_andersonii.AAC.1
MARLARQKPGSVRARRATSSTKAGAGAREATKAPTMTGSNARHQMNGLMGPPRRCRCAPAIGCARRQASRRRPAD